MKKQSSFTAVGTVFKVPINSFRFADSTQRGGTWHGKHSRLTLTCSRTDIGDKAPATGLRLGWTHLTGVTPGSSNGGTAQCLRADDACQLPLAHLIIDLCETWACPVIWNERGEGKTALRIMNLSQTPFTRGRNQKLPSEPSKDRRAVSFTLKIYNFQS